MNTIRDLSTPLPLGAISLAIDINQKLATYVRTLNGLIAILELRIY